MKIRIKIIILCLTIVLFLTCTGYNYEKKFREIFKIEASEQDNKLLNDLKGSFRNLNNYDKKLAKKAIAQVKKAVINQGTDIEEYINNYFKLNTYYLTYALIDLKIFRQHRKYSNKTIKRLHKFIETGCKINSEIIKDYIANNKKEYEIIVEKYELLVKMVEKLFRNNKNMVRLVLVSKGEIIFSHFRLISGKNLEENAAIDTYGTKIAGPLKIIQGIPHFYMIDNEKYLDFFWIKNYRYTMDIRIPVIIKKTYYGDLIFTLYKINK